MSLLLFFSNLNAASRGRGEGSTAEQWRRGNDGVYPAYPTTFEDEAKVRLRLVIGAQCLLVRGPKPTKTPALTPAPAPTIPPRALTASGRLQYRLSIRATAKYLDALPALIRREDYLLLADFDPKLAKELEEADG